MFLFSVLGGTMVMAEEVIVFIPLLVSLCKELKLDRMVARAVVMIGARGGFTTGLINPFTVGVAQGIAGLTLYSGLWYRLIWYGIILVITGWYITVSYTHLDVYKRQKLRRARPRKRWQRPCKNRCYRAIQAFRWELPNSAASRI